MSVSAIGLYVLAALFGSLDFFDMVLRVCFRRAHTKPPGAEQPTATSYPLEVGAFSPHQVRYHLEPYAIVVSVYNAEAELDEFLDTIRPYRSRLWVIDDASTDDTCARLRQAGVRCLRGTVNRKKPGALKTLVATLDPEIATVVVLDPDTRILDSGSGAVSDLERVIFEFQRSGVAALCPRLTVRDEGLLTRFQQLEFWLSFNVGRYSLSDHCVTSGIAVYRRDALARALEKHSLSVYAEDLKNAYLLLAEGERIYYDGRLTVETAGKPTWSSWFSQRVAWHFGLLKVYAETLPDLLKCSGDRLFLRYHFILYTGVFGILLHPLKMMACLLLMVSFAGGVDQLLHLGVVPHGTFTEPMYFLIAYLECSALLVVALATTPGDLANRRNIKLVPTVLLYFFYSAIHTFPITVGFLNWCSLRLVGRRVYRDHFQDDATLRQQFSGARP